MYFKKIEMQGFKSFADPVSIEFNDGVTCIIGPNGSGKSNISDALRWVLGEQSSKQLRGSKMQDVIFAGTETRKSKGMAEVSLVIDNSTGILPIEYKEVSVTRRMYRSGESEYLINGNNCRLKEVRELFMDTGIGVDGYSIIGQGKIADIVSGKPESRRQIFEEAAGVVLYKSRKTDAENKLKTANDNLDRVKDIIAEIESRIGGLKDDSEKATEYIKLRDRYKELGINIILHNLEGLEKNVKESHENLEELTEKFEELDSESKNFEEKLENFRLQDVELNEKYSTTNQTLMEKIEELNLISSGGKLNAEKLSGIEREISRIDEAIKEDEEKLESQKKEYEELEEKEKQMNSGMDEVNKTYEETVKNYNEHTSKLSEINIKIEEAKEKIVEINNKSISNNGEINTLENYKKTLQDRKENIQDEFESRDEKDEENKKQLNELQKRLEDKENELKSMKDNVETLSQNILESNKEIVSLSNTMDELVVKSNRTIARKNTIEEMEKNYEGYNNTVRLLMKQSMGGIIGTVSDLINVPSGYELAIETALGNNLQNIVCNDDASAKSAISWLKSSKVGRATFLPVSSIYADKIPLASEVKNARGFVGIASEMVEADSKYDEIVDYLLCRVIVAENMDDAILMSKMKIGGYKIVTLDGEVINAFGAITGGKFANKTANLLDRKKEIGVLTKEIDALDKEIKDVKEKREKTKSDEEKMSSDREKLNEDIQKSEIEYNVIKSDLEHIKELVDDDERNNDKINSEMSTISSDLENADKLIEKYRKEIDDSKVQIENLEKEVENMIEESSNYSVLIEEDNEKIVELKVKIGEHDSKVLAQNEILERVKDAVSELEEKINENKESKAELEKSRNLLTNTGAESSEKEEDLKKEKESLETEIAELSKKIEENKLQNEETISAQKKNSEELEKVRDEKYKLELKTAKNETLLDTQKEKLWDEFEVPYAEALDMRDENFAITAGNKESREIKLRLAEIGDVNIGAIEEYQAVSKRYEFMTSQEKDILKAMDELNEIIDNMDKTIKVKFKENFDQVVVNFEKAFKELFGGGHAELKMEDETNPLETAIEITAQPPGKKLKNINLLSGGEKTLTAIALMFAVLKAKPTPFVILDEVEAALDEVNIERFSDYLRNFSEIQFALITHQKATMEHADVLYGVTMPEQGISKMLSLKLEDDFDVEGLE